MDNRKGMILPQTQIPAGTIAAYLRTEYRFGYGAQLVVLRIDTRSDALAQLYASSGHRCGVFITAANPLGEAQGAAANEAARARLAAELDAAKIHAIEGEGVDPAGNWPAEKSFFALGVDLHAARELGARHRQNAIVWAGEDAVPKLILLR